MKQILTTLSEMNITEPAQVRAVAMLMLDAVHDRHILNQAAEVAVMNDFQITQAIQQIQGGR
jgi:hypothetical protein